MSIFRKKDFTRKVTSGRAGSLQFVILTARNPGEKALDNDENPEIFVVLLEGGMEKSTIPVLRRAIAPLFEKQHAVQLIVDLSRVTHVDSAGIATLLDWLKQCERDNLRFTLAGSTPKVQALLEMDHLKGVFKLVPPLQWVID
jgi:anti-sigma B factor antagonist